MFPRVLPAVILTMGLALPCAAPASAKNNLLFIVDASNSMRGKVEGASKIETAKAAFKNLVAGIPDNIDVGLATYGAKDKQSCTDVEFLAPFVDKAHRATLTAAVDKLEPKGKTPIAYALSTLGKEIAAKHESDNNNIVLISDGVETCNGDPCAAAEKLANGNVHVRVHVVGFNISEKDRKQLECIAKKGKGEYFSADGTKGFNDAIAKVVKVAAAEKTPPPRKPAWKEVFRDDFNGDGLSETWQVVNSNEDAYLVEDGKLLIVAGAKGGLQDPKTPNLFTLNTKLPKGDWVMTARVSVDLQTFEETFALGLYDDVKKSLSAVAYFGSSGSTYPRLYLSSRKVSAGKLKLLTAVIGRGVLRNELAAQMKPPFEIQIAKTGRKYQARIRWPDDPKRANWIKAGEVTSLRASGKPFFAAYQNANVKGESPFKVDWVKIEVPAQ